MSKLKIGQMSMREFVDRANRDSLRGADARRENEQALRGLQRLVFSMLWERAERADARKTTRIYGSLTLIGLAVHSMGKSKAEIVQRLESQSFVGCLRAQTNFQDDIRFIITTDGKEVYLVLSNEALDAKMGSLYKYTGKEFVLTPETLLQFTIRKDFLLAPLAEVSTA